MGGIEVVDPRYGALWAEAQRVLGSDPRVVDVRIGGSIAEGTADRWSDLDLVVRVDDATHNAFVGEWESWLAAITPTVFARRPIAPFIVNCVTSEGLTLDIAAYPASMGEPPGRPPGFTVGLLSRVAFDNHADAVLYAVEEQLRGLAGPFIGFLQRDLHVAHLTGVAHVVTLLTALFMAENDVAKPPGKQVDAFLTDEQRRVVASLPAVSATYDGMLAFGLALGEQIVTRGRPLLDRLDRPWPDALEAVAARRLREMLGVDVSGWLRE